MATPLATPLTVRASLRAIRLEWVTAPDAAELARPMADPSPPGSTCPKCLQSTGRFLRAASADAWVNYYKCDACGEVSAIQKRSTDPPVARDRSDSGGHGVS